MWGSDLAMLESFNAVCNDYSDLIIEMRKVKVDSLTANQSAVYGALLSEVEECHEIAYVNSLIYFRDASVGYAQLNTEARHYGIALRHKMYCDVMHARHCKAFNEFQISAGIIRLAEKNGNVLRINEHAFRRNRK